MAATMGFFKAQAQFGGGAFHSHEVSSTGVDWPIAFSSLKAYVESREYCQ